MTDTDRHRQTPSIVRSRHLEARMLEELPVLRESSKIGNKELLLDIGVRILEGKARRLPGGTEGSRKSVPDGARAHG
jgi:hypothetical protein